MNVTVLLFAQARDRAGRERVDLVMPEGCRVSDVLDRIAREHPGLEPLWPHLAVAVNGELTPAHGALSEGAEIALLPPVSGG